MADFLYNSYKEELLKAGINVTSANVRVLLANTNIYTAVVGSDTVLANIDASARVATSANVITDQTTITNGVLDFNDITYSSVAAGNAAEAIVIYEWTGTETTSNLIAYIDQATGLPVTPNGGDITITWNSGANKIFAL